MAASKGKLPIAQPSGETVEVGKKQEVVDTSLDSLSPEDKKEFEEFQRFKRAKREGQIVDEDSVHRSAPGVSGINYQLPTVVVQTQAKEPSGLVRRPGKISRGGELYVNMLNTVGVGVPVQAVFVCDRLVDGYQFIEGESCEAAKVHNKGPVFNGKPLTPRVHRKVDSLDEAAKLWKAAVEAGPRGPIAIAEAGSVSYDAEAEAAMRAIGIPVVAESNVD